MGIDGKYGRVTTEFGTIGDDEPVVVFRAQDALLPAMLAVYSTLCAQAGSPRRHLDKIVDSMLAVERWQESHHIQVPRSDPPS